MQTAAMKAFGILLWVACHHQNLSATAFAPAMPFLAQRQQAYSTFLQAKTARSETERRRRSDRPPSKVVDLDGPTPEFDSTDVDEVDEEDVPELQDIQRSEDLPRPIPHQPWRRGETAGCEAPITAEWRMEAEEIMKRAAVLVGAKVLDVTWYLTQVVVTLDEEMMPEADMLKSTGPVIEIEDPSLAVYKDPADPDPEDIWDDQDEIMYQRETEEEAVAAADRRYRRFVPKDEDDPEDEPHIADEVADDDVKLYMNEETREEVALRVTEEEAIRHEESEQPIDMESIGIDSASLSTIAEALLQALETREDELNILSRHELILTSPGAMDVLETQRQFDAFRGADIIVETQDPFESNRTLKGKLVDRNSMDLIINKQGRMVTIPHNFVKCVRLPAKREAVAP